MTNAPKIIPTVSLLLTLTIASIADVSSSQTQVNRYLLSAGANNGGRGRVLLQYAVTDAEAFASVLLDMGGVDRSNAIILANPRTRELFDGIVRLNELIAENRARAPDDRHEVFVYYSGHADADGLKLGHETLMWSVFRSAVSALEADVRVAVIDACGSGAITRTRGGTLQPAFMSDASYDMRGYVFLTSSNANEKSQESDRIRGGYFTHALLSGMRGAADLTGDGKVTINEAYQFAFNETLRSTQNTIVGAQHPNREMNLAGTGDIVLTDLRETSAVLSLAHDIEGRFFIRDASGHLFAELNKTRGRVTNLGITPGRYAVQVETPSQMWISGDVVVALNGKTSLSMSDMRPMRRRMTVARGSENFHYQSYSLNASVLGLSFAHGRGGGIQFFPVARGVGESQFGLVNIAGELESIQAGPINTAGSVGYFQAGLINATKDVGYFQAGLVNTANNAGRFQAGLLNTANDGGRFQAGLVNIASKSGRQIGLANLALHSEKTPIGILSIVGNGIYDATAYADVTGEFYTSLRTGTSRFYNLFEYSSVAHSEYTKNSGHADNFWTIGWGFGTRFGMNGRFATNLDFVWQSVGSKQERIDNVSGGPHPEIPTDSDRDGNPEWTGSPGITDGTNRPDFNRPHLPAVNIFVNHNDFYKIRFGGSYRPLSFFAITGGVSLNAVFDSFSETVNYRPAGGFYRDWELGNTAVRFWPSVYTGVTVGKTGH